MPDDVKPGSPLPDNDEVIEALLLAAREEPLPPEIQARCDALMPLVVGGPWHDVARDLIEHGTGTYFLCKLKHHVDAELATFVARVAALEAENAKLRAARRANELAVQVIFGLYELQEAGILEPFLDENRELVNKLLARLGEPHVQGT